MSDEAGAEPEISSAQAQMMLQKQRDVCQQLGMKINELDMDQNEHRLVVEALKPLDPSRKCFRMVGSVIVERTVSEILPAVTKNMEQAAPPAYSAQPLATKPVETHSQPRTLTQPHLICVRNRILSVYHSSARSSRPQLRI